MKKLVTVFTLLIASNIFAQEAEKDVKSADKKLGRYYLDTKANANNIWEAKALIDMASSKAEIAQMHKTWITKGKIYNAIAATQNDTLIISQTMNKNSKLTYPLSAADAYDALVKAFDLATKSFEKKDALDAIQETSQYLNNFGYYLFKNKEFKGAYKNFNTVVLAEQLLKKNERKSIFNNDKDINNQIYIATLAAINTGDPEYKKMVLPYMEELTAKNYDDDNGAGASLYEGLFDYYMDKDDVKAAKFLTDGRAKFPSATGLLYQEINYFLKKGKLNELIDKLKFALSKEPDNVSLYTTLGNVYDNLCQEDWKAGNMSKGDEYYAEGLKYYGLAIEKANATNQPNQSALYSIGALYYNKAAQISKEVNKLNNDYTKEGTKKYEAKKAEMESYFDKAMPYFEQAEKLDPKDKGTIIALKEIYAKKGNIAKATEYKAKLEAIK